MNEPIYPAWAKFKETLPAIADLILAEYKAVNGFIPREPGYVYLIHAVGTEYYKIGKSINPDRRILQISPKMPFNVKFVRVWRTYFMSLAEKMLHEQYAYCRVNGEWFHLSNDPGVLDHYPMRIGLLPGLLDYSDAIDIRFAYFDDLWCRVLKRLNECPDRDVGRKIWRSCTGLYLRADHRFGFYSWIEQLFSEIEHEEFSQTNPHAWDTVKEYPVQNQSIIEPNNGARTVEEWRFES